MKDQVVINGIYQHYKGHLYRVITTAQHTETGEEVVIYIRHDDPNDLMTWARPIKMWNDVVDDKGTLRFTLVDP